MTWFYIFDNGSGQLISETADQADIVDPLPSNFTVIQRADRFDGIAERWNKGLMAFEPFTNQARIDDLLRERDFVRQQITNAGGNPNAPAP